MFRSLRSLALLGLLALAGSLCTTVASAQVTTGSMRGQVTDSVGNPLEAARVTATHRPSGTVYYSTSRADGRFIIPGMRVGGPYTVEATRIGFTRQSRDGLTVTLGTSTDITFKLGQLAAQLTAVTVTSTSGEIAESRTGAATQISQQALNQLPTISRRIDDFTRLTPQASGSSFAGVDNRLNNIMVDGAYFNNSFGLQGQPGDRTGVSPISLDAIEAIQVNIAPFDVRQGKFTGAAVNTVTKSGSNELSGSLYYNFRDNSLVGTRVGGRAFDAGTFDFSQIGLRLSGPILKNKLFFFLSYEDDGLSEPGTTWRANEGGEAVSGNVTRVLRSDLEALSSFLDTNFGYATGPFQDYTHEVPSKRLTAKLDYAMSDRNKFSLRYSTLDSKADILVSNSTSLGLGNRRTRSDALNFQNSNYQQLENIQSVVAEWNSLVRDNMSNNMIIGYENHDENRGTLGPLFPTVDILNGGTTYTTFGFDPFTPANQLEYNSLQFQNNFTIYGNKHDLTFGVSVEKYESRNVFFPGSQGVYVYHSLADWYLDANDYIANPGRTSTPIVPVGHPVSGTPNVVGQPLQLRRFEKRWANIAGQTEPVQPLEVLFAGLYVQDEWRALKNLKMTFGLRVESPRFSETAFENAEVDAMNFWDETGAVVKYSTSKLPDPKLLFSPRFGFNWDVSNDGVTQIRGGSGIFTGTPAYVWISNQIGNNGVLTGFERLDNVTNRPFNPDPAAYAPTTVNGTPAPTYELAFTDKNFKFPQLWRTNLAIDRKLPWGVTGTVEWLLGQDVNGVYYIDANMNAPDAYFTGPDPRPRWIVDDCPGTGAFQGTQNRINCKVQNAIVLKNQNRGNSFNISGSLEKAFSNGLFAKTAYSYGQSRNTVDPGSIASGSFLSNPHGWDPNNPGVGFSGNSQGHRFFATVAYTRQILPFGKTGVAAFLETRNQGNGSFVYNGDLNGDGSTNNDLMYIPITASELRFQQYTVGTRTFTVAEQVAAFDAFIKQDSYLKRHRGETVERGGIWLPMVTRMDVSLTQDIDQIVMGKKNTIQLRMDILNFTNMFNSDWGRSWSFRTNAPLTPQTVGAGQAPLYRMRSLDGQNLVKDSFQRNNGIGDVWRMQFGVRYIFN